MILLAPRILPLLTLETPKYNSLNTMSSSSTQHTRLFPLKLWRKKKKQLWRFPTPWPCAFSRLAASAAFLSKECTGRRSNDTLTNTPCNPPFCTSHSPGRSTPSPAWRWPPASSTPPSRLPTAARLATHHTASTMKTPHFSWALTAAPQPFPYPELLCPTGHTPHNA